MSDRRTRIAAILDVAVEVDRSKAVPRAGRRTLQASEEIGYRISDRCQSLEVYRSKEVGPAAARLLDKRDRSCPLDSRNTTSHRNTYFSVRRGVCLRVRCVRASDSLMNIQWV